MPILYSIYLIICLVNNKRYIGFTSKNSKERWKEHLNSAYIKDSICLIHCAIRKYGEENFIIKEIYQSTDKNHCLNTMEEYFIRKFKSHVSKGGYNMTWGGEGGSYPHTFEYKQKISNEGNPFYGKKHTLETKEKIRQMKLGNSLSESTKQKMSNKRKGGNVHNAILWNITDPLGNVIITKDLTGFCVRNNINKHSLKTAFRQGRNFKGFTLERL